MRHEAFQEWRREREAVEQEMDLLITAGLPASNEERQVRRTRFAALLERREAAARNLLHSDRTRRRDRSPADSSGPGDRLISAAHAGAGVEGGPATFVPLPDGRTKADAQSELPVHVTTAASPFDAVALALDAAALPADADTASTAGVAADAAERPSEVMALALDASPPTEFDAVAAIGLPADVAEPATEKAALASDATDFAPDPATVAAAGLPADAAAPSTEKVALAPDVTAVVPDPATVTAAGLPADVAELPADVIAPERDATARLPDPAASLPSAAAEPSIEVVALAPTTTAVSFTESAGLFTPPVAVANRSDAAPLAGDAKVQSASSSDDSHSDASLLKLLRRLKPKIGPGWQRSGG